MNRAPVLHRPMPLGVDQIHLAEPDAGRMAAFRNHLATKPFSYPDVGATQGELPAGWEPDTHTIELGGPEVYDRAAEALAAWVMFDLPWVRMSPESGQQPGDLVTFASHQLGVWMLHGCRTVYRIDEPDRVGFGYGTLEGHAVAGEEQFLVTRTERAVTYSVRKFSRVAHPLARLVPGIARRLQHRFSEESAERMRRACLG